MTAPQRNTAATPESNDGVAAPAVGPASVTEKHTLTVDPMEGVICEQCGVSGGHVIGCPDSVPPRAGFKSFDERRDYYTAGAHSIDCESDRMAAIRARFERLVIVGKSDECWEWTGAKIRQGYGRMYTGIKGEGTHTLAHRLAWEFANGRPVPEGLLILHSCRSRGCCNPAHLRPGTHRENSLDRTKDGMDPNAKKTHCAAGHPYDDENTYRRPNPRMEGAVMRGCKKCMAVASIRYRAKQEDRAAEKDARELRILSALYAHWHTEDEQAARVARFRLAEGFDVWCFEDGEPRDDEDLVW